jgi:hypothetical protein
MAKSFGVKFSMFIDKPGVFAAIDRKRARVLAKTGAFGRVVMKRQIRPPKAGRKLRTVVVGGRQFFVPTAGRVIDVATGKPCSKAQAREARITLARQLKEPAGSPPRRGPTDKLRKNIFFGVDPETASTVVGPLIFNKQPAGIMPPTVPELLEFGGTATSKLGLPATYPPHPFAGPSFDPTLQQFERLIESEPLK